MTWVDCDYVCVCVFASALVAFPLGDMGWSVIMCVCVCHCFGGFSSW